MQSGSHLHSPEAPAWRPVQFRLNPPVTGVLRLVLMAGLLFLLAAFNLVTGGGMDSQVLSLLLLGGLPILWIWWSNRKRRAEPVVLELLEDSVLLPLGLSGPSRLRVRYSELTGLFLSGKKAGGVVFVGTEVYDFAYPVRAFASPEEAQQFVELVELRLQTLLIDGESRLQKYRQEGKEASIALARPLQATKGLVFGLLGLQGLALLIHSQTDPFWVVDMVAVSKPLLMDGAWGHFFLAHLVHHSLWDALLVTWAAFPLAKLLEQVYGTMLTLAVIAVGALMGGAGILLSDTNLHMGASPIVFALAGAAAFTGHRFRGAFPRGMRTGLRWWVWRGISLFLVFAVTFTDFSVCIAGFLAGVLAAGLISEWVEILPAKTTPSTAKYSLWVVIGLFVVSLIYQVANPKTQLEIEAIISETSQQPLYLMEYANKVSALPEVTAERLKLAERAALRSIDVPNRGALGWLDPTSRTQLIFQDAYAAVLFRQGRLEEAIRLQYEVLDGMPFGMDGWELPMANKLARFLKEQQKTGPVPSPLIELSQVAGELQVSKEGKWLLQLTKTPTVAQRTMIYGIVQRQQETVGLLRFSIVPEGSQGNPREITIVPETGGMKIEGISDLSSESYFTPLFATPGKASAKIWRIVQGSMSFPEPI